MKSYKTSTLPKMENTQMLTGLKKIISQQVIMDSSATIHNLNEQTDLRNDLGIDSIDLINIAADIENYFDIEIGYESIEKLTTIENCLGLIQHKMTQFMRA